MLSCHRRHELRSWQGPVVPSNLGSRQAALRASRLKRHASRS